MDIEGELSAVRRLMIAAAVTTLLVAVVVAAMSSGDLLHVAAVGASNIRMDY